MPDRVPSLLQTLSHYGEQILQAVVLALVGMLIGIGQLLASAELLTWRIVVGRALSTGGLGAAAGMPEGLRGEQCFQCHHGAHQPCLTRPQ